MYPRIDNYAYNLITMPVILAYKTFVSLTLTNQSGRFERDTLICSPIQLQLSAYFIFKLPNKSELILHTGYCTYKYS